MHEVQRHDEEQRDASTRGIPGPEPQEVLPPDARTATLLREGDRRGDEPAVDDEIGRREQQQRKDQCTGRGHCPGRAA